MRERSAIEWTDSTWNPVTGCTKVSAGCDNCYAHALANVRLRDTYLRNLPVIPSAENAADPFAVRLWPDRLNKPAEWRTPRRIFVNSMSDVFHKDIPEGFVRRMFEVMIKADRHIYQVLTKRPGRAIRFWQRNADLLPAGEVPGHIWLGTTVENQEVGFRVNQLRQVPATVRFLSCEPLLGQVDIDLTGIHWVIAGGESGAGFRPIQPDWIRALRDQCTQANVAFFFKQWGGRTPKAGGRLLDGREWSEYPAPAPRTGPTPAETRRPAA